METTLRVVAVADGAEEGDYVSADEGEARAEARLRTPQMITCLECAATSKRRRDTNPPPKKR